MAISVNGQTNVYHPFPESKAIWRDTTCGMSSIQLSNDTLVNGQTFHKLLINSVYYPLSASGFCEYFNQPNFISYYGGAIRQDSSLKKVYFLLPDSTDEVLLYDFNSTVGDTIKTYLSRSYHYQPYSTVVTSVDSIQIGTQFRKRWTYSVSNGNTTKVIEGIGNIQGLLVAYETIFYFGNWPNIICFSHNNQTLYPFYNPNSGCSQVTGLTELPVNGNISVFPNPSNGSLTVDFANMINLKEILLYNLLGKIVFHQEINNQNQIKIDNLPGGVYILTVINNDNMKINKKIISSP